MLAESSALHSAWERLRGVHDRITVWGNRQPTLTIRRVLWLFTAGLWLGLLYLVGGLAFLATLVFLPFALQLFRISLFAMDGGITLEPVDNLQRLSLRLDTSPWNNPAHPYTIAANVVWAVVFGWAMVLAHLTAALVQAATIVGISTALTNVQLATYVIWPFGRTVRRKALPTTLEELYAQRAASDLEASTRRSTRWWL